MFINTCFDEEPRFMWESETEPEACPNCGGTHIVSREE